tara:strand:+ start:200 stop:499 length:300 start_codon:yes stop_codon:yes gene_type:complete
MEKRKLEKPVGDFIITTGKGIMTEGGAYYHYEEVIKMIKKDRAEQLTLAGVGSCPDLTSVWNEAVTKQDKGEHNLFVTNDCWGALRLLEKHGLCKISKL